ncbi:PAS domain-containing protein [uncultured Tateyamaria sp.]|uniref:PAS domain-containing protein n=1 Tax=uncultured Tateyamaria sp. TaxID=455651 RepID=UPI00262A13EB|nr:PAS domain-containing protein [uncultured Tateyamaria sp.]
MTEFRAEIGYSAISQVEAYWEGLRGMRMMPKRSEIDPRGIESALEYTFVLERIAPGMARIRIAGSHLSDLMGMEVRGMPLTSFITPPGRRQVSDALEEVFQRPAVSELRLSGEVGVNKPHMDARLLLLPLKSDLGDVSRVLGCFVAQGDIGRAPRRFDVVGAKIRSISAPSTLPASQPDPKPEPAPMRTGVDGFAEPKVRFEAHAPRPDVPYLRLVKNDD